MSMQARYDDGRISCDDRGIRIAWYYPWGAKWIPYSSIRSVETRPLTAVRGKWRLWGSGDFVHWYNLDPTRRNKEVGLELDLSGRVRPVITPDDPAEVEAILAEHLSPPTS
jgi:hypothetical protein